MVRNNKFENIEKSYYECIGTYFNFEMILFRIIIRVADKTLSALVWDRLAEALRNQDIDENNRICVSECIKIFWDETSYNDEV